MRHFMTGRSQWSRDGMKPISGRGGRSRCGLPPVSDSDLARAAAGRFGYNFSRGHPVVTRSGLGVQGVSRGDGRVGVGPRPRFEGGSRGGSDDRRLRLPGMRPGAGAGGPLAGPRGPVRGLLDLGRGPVPAQGRRSGSGADAATAVALGVEGPPGGGRLRGGRPARPGRGPDDRRPGPLGPGAGPGRAARLGRPRPRRRGATTSALREIEGAVAQARTFEPRGLRPARRAARRRDRASLREAEGQAGGGRRPRPRPGRRRVAHPRRAGPTRPALAPLAEAIEARLAASRLRQAEADLDARPPGLRRRPRRRGVRRRRAAPRPGRRPGRPRGPAIPRRGPGPARGRRRPVRRGPRRRSPAGSSPARPRATPPALDRLWAEPLRPGASCPSPAGPPGGRSGTRRPRSGPRSRSSRPRTSSTSSRRTGRPRSTATFELLHGGPVGLEGPGGRPDPGSRCPTSPPTSPATSPPPTAATPTPSDGSTTTPSPSSPSRPPGTSGACLTREAASRVRWSTPLPSGTSPTNNSDYLPIIGREHDGP